MVCQVEEARRHSKEKEMNANSMGSEGEEKVAGMMNEGEEEGDDSMRC